MAHTTWNPADLSNVTLSGGNLTATPTSSGGVRSTDSVTAGKYYFEVTLSAGGSPSGTAFGIANATAILSGVATTGSSAAIANGSGGVAINGTGQTGVGNIGNNGVCCMAFDMGTKVIWFRNGAAGNWNGSGAANPATGVGGYSFSGLTGGSATLYALEGGTTSAVSAVTANFGDTAFAGVVPAGFTSGFPAGGGAAGSIQARAMVLA